jgi:hypothetical protein
MKAGKKEKWEEKIPSNKRHFICGLYTHGPQGSVQKGEYCHIEIRQVQLTVI